MSIVGQLGLIAGAVGALLTLMAMLSVFARRRSWPAEVQRKCVHLITGLYALSFPFVFQGVWSVLVLAVIGAAVVAVLRLPRFAAWPPASALHGVGRKSYGDLLLPLSVGLIFLLAKNNPVLFVLPIAVLSLSDSAAALIGTRYGRSVFYAGTGTKSIEGVAAFFLVTWLVATVVLLAMTPMRAVDAVFLSLFIAAFGAFVEANSWGGLDNLFVPLGIYLFLSNRLAVTPQQLIVLMIVFLAILSAMLALAADLGLSRHAARAYAILVFIVFAAAGPFGAGLAVAALLGHVAARRLWPRIFDRDLASPTLSLSLAAPFVVCAFGVSG